MHEAGEIKFCLALREGPPSEQQQQPQTNK